MNAAMWIWPVASLIAVAWFALIVIAFRRGPSR